MFFFIKATTFGEKDVFSQNTQLYQEIDYLNRPQIVYKYVVSLSVVCTRKAFSHVVEVLHSQLSDLFYPGKGLFITP